MPAVAVEEPAVFSVVASVCNPNVDSVITVAVEDALVMEIDKVLERVLLNVLGEVTAEVLAAAVDSVGVVGGSVGTSQSA